MYTFTEENYLKTIYKIAESNSSKATTTGIAALLDIPPSSVTDMVKKLSAKGLIDYEKHHGVNLTDAGKKVAMHIIRKHRLWEVFLVEKLDFKWDEIHQIAEQLEHIDSEELIERLDKHLNYPQFDPHGDPIPDRRGILPKVTFEVLNQIPINTPYVITAVNNHSDTFLKYLTKLNIRIGDEIQIIEITEYDNSLQILLNNTDKMFISENVGHSLLVEKKQKRSNK
jgi:DtxR family Mn-dependent transcriptional regulator